MHVQLYCRKSDRFTGAHFKATKLVDGRIINLTRAFFFSTISSLAVSSFAMPAFADTSAEVRVESDHRYRGRSLSDGQPVLTVGASHELANGVYGGVRTAATLLGEDRAGPLLGQLYAGFSKNLDKNLSIDAGISGYHYTRRSSINQDVEYFEIYTGITRGNVSGYIYFIRPIIWAAERRFSILI